jgi:hypothetical protein
MNVDAWMIEGKLELWHKSEIMVDLIAHTHTFFVTSNKIQIGLVLKYITSYSPDGMTHSDTLPHGSTSIHSLNVVGHSPSLQQLQW